MKDLNQIISLQDLLRGRCEDFDNTSHKAIQLIRHADPRVRKSSKNGDSTDLRIFGKPVPAGIEELYDMYVNHRGLFDKYQSEQLKGRFNDTKYWVVFLGEVGSTSRFLGVYEIMGRTPSEHDPNGEVLDLREVPEFRFLEEKIIIDWGKSTVSWHQYYNNNKNVIRIEEGLTKADGTPVFKSYPEVVLDYNQLLLVLKDEEWIQRLKELNCVYLIVDKSNGKKYVGSTYGQERIYGRWAKYAKSGHAGNVELEKMIRSNPTHHEENFQWSILQTLDSFVIQPEAIRWEGLWKKKLYTLNTDFGYNKN